MKVHRNYLDNKFCPVFWMMFWLSYSGIRKGPIFQNKNEHGAFEGIKLHPDVWVRMTTKLFTLIGLYKPAYLDEDNNQIDAKGCTNHAIRKTACQWAGRCSSHPMDCKNNGRWKGYDQMSQYHSQGAAKRKAITDKGGNDPIWKVWVWKPSGVPMIDGKDQM
jgi:hypothetical protein